jgi:hypothetical protein
MCNNIMVELMLVANFYNVQIYKIEYKINRL